MTQAAHYPAIQLERLIAASPAEVYDAWLDPETLLLWLAPGGLQITKAEVESHVGGHYRIWHTADGVNAGGFECEIMELVPAQRIVFRWGFVGPARTAGPVYDSLLTIHVEQTSEGITRLTLIHEQLDALAASLPHVAAQVGNGWESVLSKLTAMFKNERRDVHMRKVVVCEWMSLDGVIQSPSAPDEDTSGGFIHGGWHPPYFEAESMQWVVDNVSGAGGFLFGRRTYDIFAAHWPNASAQEQALAHPLNTRPKYVVSGTLQAPLAWNNSAVLGPSWTDEVRALKNVDGGDLLVIGSTELVHALLAHDLVDELRLMVDPLCLGAGKKLFASRDTPLHLRLVSSQAVSTGALLITYARA
jgi:dihydrofolate reductase/uncharacterized protein YndB with AHSA1/START domain